jgi:hypothetical protein
MARLDLRFVDIEYELWALGQFHAVIEPQLRQRRLLGSSHPSASGMSSGMFSAVSGLPFQRVDYRAPISAAERKTASSGSSAPPAPPPPAAPRPPRRGPTP